MSSRMARTLTPEEWEVVQNSAELTAVSDWVMVTPDLSLEARVLYVQMSRLARIHDTERAMRITLPADELDRLSQGDGQKAIEELKAVGAVTVVARYKGGSVRYETEQYPPQIREYLKQFAHVRGLPMVSYG